VDVSAGEHALYARKFMLGLSETDNRFTVLSMFTALSAAEIAEFGRNGVPRDVLDFLSKANDPRIYMIQKRRWVRIRQQAFYLWTLDDATLSRIRDADEYWRAQLKYDHDDVVDIIELSTNSEYPIPARTLRYNR